MNLLKIIFAVTLIFFFELFVTQNAKSAHGGGSGYIYLVMIATLFIALLFLSGDVLNVVLIKKCTFLLIIFLTYYIAKFYFESGDYEETKQISIGTSGGTVFAFLMGLTISYAIKTIYQVANTRHASLIAICLIYAVFGIVLYTALINFNFHYNSIRTDKFLVTADGDLSYQRPGDLMIMGIMTACAVVVCIVSVARNQRLSTIVLPMILLLVGLTSIFGITAQLIGSNKGLVSTVAYLFVSCVVMVTFLLGHKSTNNISILNLLFGRLGAQILVSALVISLTFALATFALVQITGFDVSLLRITGYGEGESASITSRKEIFRTAFIPHFNYSPFFGHTLVHEIVETPEMNYVHSIASILTHLGIVGGLIFTLMLFLLYKAIISSTRLTTIYSIVNDSRYALFKLSAIAVTLAMCAYSAFFNWMPLWFALGLYGDWINWNNRQVLTNNQSARKRKSKKRKHSYG